GIDIREGLQYECIACAACVDVCNEVMDRMGYERGLVRYTTENAANDKPTRVLRPRTAIYASLLTLVLLITAVSLAYRPVLRFDVIRDRNSLYRIVSGGDIENVYSLRIMNLDDEDHEFIVDVVEPAGMTIETEPARPVVGAGAIEAIAARIRTQGGTMSGSQPIVLRVAHATNPDKGAEEPARFFAPANNQ
ncbi:MAG: cytochrome c oxidase accessory protein CcoG, partial [Gammaproteobacteria bacterium]|nr:cytochrome c oxidase accessory protein CcoG [Gammaproteobacteria bacterium]